MSKFVVLLVSICVFPTTIHADKIHIGVSPAPAHLALRLAERVGFLKAEDFDAENIIITGPVAAMAVTSSQPLHQGKSRGNDPGADSYVQAAERNSRSELRIVTQGLE